MADAAVPRTRQDDAFEHPDEAEGATSASAVLLRQSPILALLWGLFALLLFGLLFFAEVRIGAGAWSGRGMRITRIWSGFLDFLTEQGASAAVISVVVAAVAVTLIGAVCLVWLAMRMQDNAPPTSPEDIPGS